jgi:hypothetical protein
MANDSFDIDSRMDDDSVVSILQNRTLIAEKLTESAPLRPEVVHGLQNIKQVFQYYKPEVNVRFEDAEGFVKNETIKFTDMHDLLPGAIAAQSEFLTEKTLQKEQYLSIMQQLRSNKILAAAVGDTEGKKTLLAAIHSMIDELKNNK